MIIHDLRISWFLSKILNRHTLSARSIASFVKLRNNYFNKERHKNIHKCYEVFLIRNFIMFFIGEKKTNKKT